jgi:Tol biopolymer transport system component
MRATFLFFMLCISSGMYAQYFNLQFPDNSEPAIFGPDVISDGLPNRDMAISPSNDELFYTLQYGTQFNAILYCKKVKSLWSKPVIAWFSGKYGDMEPAFSPDGKRLYFTSNRPLTDTGKAAKDFDIWYLEKKGYKWGAPVNMGPVINTTKDEFYASVTKKGDLYFTRDNDSSKDDIFFSGYNNGVYATPVALGEEINSKGYDFNSFTDPDENYIIFSSYKRNDDMGGGDLYISVKKKRALDSCS